MSRSMTVLFCVVMLLCLVGSQTDPCFGQSGYATRGYSVAQAVRPSTGNTSSDNDAAQRSGYAPAGLLPAKLAPKSKPAQVVQVEAVYLAITIPASDDPTPKPSLEKMVIDAAAQIGTDDAPNDTDVAMLQKLLTPILREQGVKLRTWRSMKLTTVSMHSGMVQSGSRVPRITGTQSSTRGTTNSILQENVGTILSITPEVNDNGTILLEVDFELSQLAPIDEGVLVSEVKEPIAREIRVPAIDTTTIQTILLAKPGAPILAGGMTSESSNGNAVQSLLIIRAVLP